jgi:hypothetical protein
MFIFLILIIIIIYFRHTKIISCRVLFPIFIEEIWVGG